jgi:low molecular weight protein-tyrosine phosphatase
MNDEPMGEPGVSVLFVCLGNICRSPLAEAVFREFVVREGLTAEFDIDSAGTSGYHDGQGADPRTIEVAARRGVRVDSISRRIVAEDFDRFSLMLAMDEDNLERLEHLSARVGASTEIRLLREFDPEANGDLAVPDPYYGGTRGFDNVQDIVERSCSVLLDELRRRHKL